MSDTWYSRFKAKCSKLFNILLGVGKAVAMTGGTVFTTQKGMQWLSEIDWATKNAHTNTVITDGAAAACATGTLGTQILVRYFNIQRSPKTKLFIIRGADLPEVLDEQVKSFVLHIRGDHFEDLKLYFITADKVCQPFYLSNMQEFIDEIKRIPNITTRNYIIFEESDLKRLMPTDYHHIKKYKIKEIQHSNFLKTELVIPGFTVKDLIYGLAQSNTTLYAFYSGLMGYLGAFSLAQLVSSILQNTTHYSNDDQDDYTKIILLNTFGIYLAMANIVSFWKFNREMIFDDLLPGLLNGEWKKFPWYVHAITFSNTLLASSLSVISNKHTADLLNEKLLGKISPALTMSPGVKNIFIAGGVTTFIINNILICNPALNKLFKNIVKDPNEHQDFSKVTECHYLHHYYLAYVFFILNDIGQAFGNTISISNLLGTMHVNYDTDYSKIITIIASFLGTLLLLAQDHQGFIRELTTRLEERDIPDVSSIDLANVSASENNHSAQPLLSLPRFNYGSSSSLVQQGIFASPRRASSVMIDVSDEKSDVSVAYASIN